MHFWIDKRSGEWGRRGCVGVGGKVMVTPVHRFQAVEAVVGRSYHAHHRCAPRHSSSITVPRPHAAASVSAPELDAAVLYDHTSHHHLACHPGVQAGPSLAATGRLKCGMWASFALVTVFMAGAKFYFNTQSTGLEVLVFCALLVVVLFAGCAVSLCEAVTQPTPPQGGVVTTAPAVVMVNSIPSVAPSASNTTSAPAVVTPAAGGTVSSEAGGEPPPPPYHIAVLLPPPHAPPGPPSPPPAYDKAVSVS